MGTTSGFIYSVINFCILIGIVVLFVRPLVRQFFFARHLQVKKKMDDSLVKLKEARLRVSMSRDLFDSVGDEIKVRRKEARASIRDQCDAILSEARMKENHIMKVAARQAEQERDRSIAMLRTKLIAEAFARAERKLTCGVVKEKEMKMIETGFEKMSKGF